MAPLSRPVEPFGEVNARPQPDGSLQIVATVLMEPDVENAACGLALDASASMKKVYGASSPVSPLFRPATAVPNVVEPVARTMAAYLAGFSSDGKASLIYWACDPAGDGIEEIGDVDEVQAQTISISGVKKKPWGRGTRLLPALRYYIDNKFKDAKWGLVIFVTDGIVEDLDDVKQYTLQYAQQIAAGKRDFVKLVLIGLGDQVDEEHMEALDDLDYGGLTNPKDGAEIDLWDHKLASEMKKLEEVFAEVVSENTMVAASGRVLTNGRVVKEYADGVPALLRFTLPAGSKAFTLEFPGGGVTQDITEGLSRI